jgi:hypothetical protein
MFNAVGLSSASFFSELLSSSELTRWIVECPQLMVAVQNSEVYVLFVTWYCVLIKYI